MASAHCCASPASELAAAAYESTAMRIIRNAVIGHRETKGKVLHPVLHHAVVTPRSQEHHGTPRRGFPHSPEGPR